MSNICKKNLKQALAHWKWSISPYIGNGDYELVEEYVCIFFPKHGVKFMYTKGQIQYPLTQAVCIVIQGLRRTVALLYSTYSFQGFLGGLQRAS